MDRLLAPFVRICHQLLGRGGLGAPELTAAELACVRKYTVVLTAAAADVYQSIEQEVHSAQGTGRGEGGKSHRLLLDHLLPIHRGQIRMDQVQHASLVLTYLLSFLVVPFHYTIVVAVLPPHHS